MKTSGFTQLLALFLCAIFLFSCDGEKGDQGDPGPQGEQGQSGTQGPKGEIGSANVIQYKFAGPSNTSNPYEFGYSLINLPSGISMSNSIFMVYVLPPDTSIDSDTWWAPLPSILPSNYTQNRPGFYRFYAGIGTSVYIQRRSMDGSGNPIPDIPKFAARILIIPAAVLRNARYSAEFLNDYKAVQKEFNLPD
jgi:hypothetical protein